MNSEKQRNEKIETISRILGISSEEARNELSMNDGDVEKVINNHYDK